MSAKPITMHKIRQVLQLCQLGRSLRGIQKITGVSRTTINGYLVKVESSGEPISDLLLKTDEELSESLLIGPAKVVIPAKASNATHFKQHLDYFRKELKRIGVTRLLLWEEYKQSYPIGYEYTQFCHHLSLAGERENAVMHFSHKPAELMEIDFAGDTLGYVDISTGELIQCQILVCVLPFSGYLYCCALPSQKQECFLRGIAQSLQYIGGVPYCLKTDNLRSAVKKASRYEPEFTEAMELFSSHYNTTSMATRVRKPRDKSSVENGVQNVYRRVYAPIRNTIFHSIEALNAAIRIQNDLFNDRLLQGRKESRRGLYEEFERPFLRELPSAPYSCKSTTESKVQRNYHVIIGEDFHHYSVPYILIGARLKIIYCDQQVEIYKELKRVAIHKRSFKKHGYSTLKEHMPPNHQATKAQQGWNADRFIAQAETIGVNTKAVIEGILRSKIYKEQTYNSCLGIFSLGKKFGNARLEAACNRMLPSGKYGYRTLLSVLNNKLDQAPDTSVVSTIPIPFHDNIRGPLNYN